MAAADRAADVLGWRPQRLSLEEMVRSAWARRRNTLDGYADQIGAELTTGSATSPGIVIPGGNLLIESTLPSESLNQAAAPPSGPRAMPSWVVGP